MKLYYQEQCELKPEVAELLELHFKVNNDILELVEVESTDNPYDNPYYRDLEKEDKYLGTTLPEKKSTHMEEKQTPKQKENFLTPKENLQKIIIKRK